MATKRKRSGALWTVRYRGADPFGGAILDQHATSATAGIERLCRAKKAGWIDLFSAHDDDIYPFDPENPFDYLNPNDPIHAFLAKVKAKLDAAGLPMHMITCSLHGDGIFANGGFANPCPAVRMLANQKAGRAAWIGNYFGATVATYWVARDGFEVSSAVPFIGLNPKNPDEDPTKWIAEALDLISFTCITNNYSIKRATIEPKTNEPRSIVFLPLVSSALMLISQLRNPDFWGVNPEIPQHAAMANQSPLMEIVNATRIGKLFFLHVGGQINGQFDNDFPLLVGNDNFKTMMEIFWYLDMINWDGVIEFDCHALRSDLATGKEIADEILDEFLQYNSETYEKIEVIIIPRISSSKKLKDAQMAIWHPNGVPCSAYEETLRAEPSAEKIAAIMSTHVDVSTIPRANCLAVESAFNDALLGI